jgi:hypothetical protein
VPAKDLAGVGRKAMRASTPTYVRFVMGDVSIDAGPGSPWSGDEFHAWCRAHVAFEILVPRIPKLFFADGPTQPEPEVRLWELAGEPPSTEEFLIGVIPRWIEDSAASQIGVSVPFGGETPGVTLLTVDEASAQAEQVEVALVNDQTRLGAWEPVSLDQLPVAEWQQTLQRNAGYLDFAKWRCRRCQSVCPGEADTVPSPCDFCGSGDIECVPLATPLAPPVPPWQPERTLRIDSPFVQTLLGIIHGRGQG